MVRLGVLLTALVLALAPALAAQQTPANTALIVGRVVDQADGKPIGGAVVEAVMESAIAGATIAGGPPRRQMTDGLGRFVFRDLQAGTYGVRARVGGTGFGPSGVFISSSGSPIASHVAGGFGQRRPGGPLESIQIAEGQVATDVVVRLWRGGALSGTVLDDLGEPVIDSVVGAARLSGDGRIVDGPTTTTDDRGRYRLSSLLPGRYVVFVPQMMTAMSAELADAGLKRIDDLNAARTPGEAFLGLPEAVGVRVGNSIVNMLPGSNLIVGSLTPRRDGDSVFVFQTTFHPQATALASATAVELGVSEQRSGVDVSMQPVRAAQVSGTVMDAGAPASGVRIRLLPSGSAPEAALFQSGSTMTDALGRFTFPVVPVGNYTIETLIAPPAPPATSAVSHSVAHPGGAGAWLSERVGVGPDGVTGLLFTLKNSYSLKAQVEFTGSSARSSDQQLSMIRMGLLALQPRGRSDFGSVAAQGAPAATGAVSFEGLPPGRYSLRMTSSPPGTLWRLLSVTVGGREVNDLPIEISEDIGDVRIVLTDRAASVAGRVAFSDPAGGSPAVFLFPSDRRLWPDARALTRRFRLARTTPAGEFSVTDVPPGDYFVVAIDDSAAAGWPDAAFVAALAPLADSVKVEAGNRAAVSLTVKVLLVKHP